MCVCERCFLPCLYIDIIYITCTLHFCLFSAMSPMGTLCAYPLAFCVVVGSYKFSSFLFSVLLHVFFVDIWFGIVVVCIHRFSFARYILKPYRQSEGDRKERNNKSKWTECFCAKRNTHLCMPLSCTVGNCVGKRDKYQLFFK